MKEQQQIQWVVGIWTTAFILAVSIFILGGCAHHEGADGTQLFHLELPKEKPEAVTGCVVTKQPLKPERTIDLCKV